MKLYVIAGLHGDEPFSVSVLEELKKLADSQIVLRVGHPGALEQGQRLIETDLNRSFGLGEDSLETGLAAEIIKEMQAARPDIVIDLHTSKSDIGRVAIAAKIDPETELLAQNLGMDSLVLMPQDVTKNSLIGNAPCLALSVEFGSSHQTLDEARRFAKHVAQIVGETASPETPKLPVFEVTSTIPKNYQALSSVKNLQFAPDLQGYPFLAGPTTYEDIGGFLAKKRA